MTEPRTASEQIIEEVTSWPGVKAESGDRGELAFKLGRREIGHLHGDRAAHFSFPKQMWSELMEQGRIVPHPVFPDSQGPAARRIEDQTDVRDVIELLRINYDRFVARHGLPADAAQTTRRAPAGRSGRRMVKLSFLGLSLVFTACATMHRYDRAVLKGFTIDEVREAAQIVVERVAPPPSVVRTTHARVMTEGPIGVCSKHVGCGEGPYGKIGPPWTTIKVEFRDLGMDTAVKIDIEYETRDHCQGRLDVGCSPELLSSTGVLEQQIITSIRGRLAGESEEIHEVDARDLLNPRRDSLQTTGTISENREEDDEKSDILWSLVGGVLGASAVHASCPQPEGCEPQ